MESIQFENPLKYLQQWLLIVEVMGLFWLQPCICKHYEDLPMKGKRL